MDAQSYQPKAQYPPGQGLRLDNIAGDVQYVIATELANLSPSSNLAMAQTSRRLRQIALPLVHRDVVLRRGNEDPKTVKAYEALIELFRGRGECSIAQHVRNLVVKDELPTDDIMMILDTISEVGVLRKLSWETTAHIPPSVLDKLHKTWPDLELSISVLDGKYGKKSDHQAMDEKPLCSSLLRKLTYDVTSHLQWAKLTRAISIGGSLRVLRIKVQRGGEESEDDPLLEVAQAFHPPALEEVTLHGGYYNDLDEEHCRMLADTVDISTLHTLNIASGLSTPFFKVFAGRLPGLKTLRVELGHNVNADVTAAFIKSVEGLELLDIDGPASVVDTVWPAIVQHRATLKNLCLRQDVEVGRLEEVVNSFPSVERLGWNVPYEKMSDYLGLISRMNLERLELFMYLPHSADDYCDELIRGGMGGMDSPSLDKNRFQAIAVQMMQSLAADEGYRLERLTLHLRRADSDYRGDPIWMWANLQIRRDNCVGRQNHFAFFGKQRWENREKVEEELELEWPVVF